MKVAIVSPGQDTGGVGRRWADAIARHRPDWTARAMQASRTYLDYPSGEVWTREGVRELMAWADVWHIKNGLGPFWHFSDRTKPTLLTHQGSIFRAEPERWRQQVFTAGAILAVSTVDLTALAPEAYWLPNPVDVDALEALRAEAGREGRLEPGTVRILHSPTNRRVKDTDWFLRTMDELALEYPPGRFTVQVMEKRSNADVLAAKATADIVYDQCRLGYGMNSLEAWAMGIPVVVGADRAIADRILKYTGGMAPVIPALAGNAATLKDRMRTLIDDPDYRAKLGARGQAYVRRFHDYGPAVDTLEWLYGLAAERRKAA